MDYVTFLDEKYLVTFSLLFIRWSAILAFMPVFNSTTIPMQFKASFAIWLTFITFPLVPLVKFEITTTTIILSIINEVTFGFFTGIIMQLAFIILQFAGQLISFVMGLTMANIIDPSSGIQTPLISHFLTITATTLFLAINGHHLALMLIANSLQHTPFGEFFYIQGVGEYLIKETSNFFKLGFSLAFPILSISILSDVIFGMIMKSMPQFNMLVIGFPIKIGLSIAVIIAILSSLMFMFKRELFDIFKTLSTII